MAQLDTVTKKMAKREKFKDLWRHIFKYRVLYLMILGGIAYYVIFCYLPLYGILIAFKSFKFKLGILRSPWVGLDNFIRVFTNKAFYNVFKNTLIISLGKLITGFPAPLILALLLNELKQKTFKRVTQSVLYLPYFLSWIIVAGLCFNLFSSTNGVIPKLVATFGIEMPSLITDPRYFRAFLYVTDIWKNAGWGTIIYLAAIAGIDPALYEAAVIDGCNRFKQMIYVTLPSISTTIVVLLVLSLGNIMYAGFDQVFNLYSNRVYGVADIIDTYVYRMGLINGDYESSAVVGLTQSVINSLLLFSANFVTGKLSDEGSVI